MNKVLIVLLALCLVYVHAFVKREAEAPKEENVLENAAKKIQELAKDAGQKISESLDPENVKKGFNDLVDNFNKALNNFKSENVKQQ